MIENDLRAMFRERADDADEPVPERISQIRTKVSQQRRRRVTGAVAAVAALIVVITLSGFAILSDTTSAPMPAERPGDTERFPATVNGDTKLDSMIGDKGDRSVRLTFTPDDTDFLVDFDCAGTSASDRFRIGNVNGSSIDPGCKQGDAIQSVKALGPGSIGGVATVDDVRRYWRRHGVVAGEPVTIEFRTKGASAAKYPFDGRLGIGVYDMSGERVVDHGVALPRERTVEGVTYALADHVLDPVGGGSGATIDIPAVESPPLVVYGRNTAVLGGVDVTLDGELDVLPNPEWAWAAVLPDAERHRVDVNRRDVESGTVFVAYYTRADDG